jgi:hypothetical protein
VGTLAPPGGVVTTAVVGEQGARFEYDKAYAMVPAGGAMIVRSDGSTIVINPAEKTYWQMPKPDAARAASVASGVKVERTGTFETIAGVRAERAAIDIRVALPIPADAAMPGFPSDIVITGDVWLADEFKKYAAMSSSFSAIAGSLGSNPLASTGFPMRSIMRSELFAGQEIESVVTNVSEIPATAGAFEIPTGFTEVAPPRPSLPMPPGR